MGTYLVGKVSDTLLGLLLLWLGRTLDSLVAGTVEDKMVSNNLLDRRVEYKEKDMLEEEEVAFVVSIYLERNTFLDFVGILLDKMVVDMVAGT